MTTGVMEFADLRALFEHDDGAAHVRALLRLTESGWVLRHLWALVGFEPPCWTEQTWRYAEVALVASVISRADLALVCNVSESGSMTIGDFPIEVPKAQGPAPWRREPSFARLDRGLLPRPTQNFTIAFADHSDRTVGQDRMLVGVECPSFPDLNTAWRAFTEDNFDLIGAPDPSTDLATVRLAESRGWIGEVHITATEASVAVHGEAVAGCELEMYGVAERISQPLDGPGTVVFPLAGGLPRHAWLWLKHETTWLDYRPVDPESGYAGDLARAGVNIDVPVDPQANIEALIAAGEGPHVEFKEQIAGRRQLKTVAAFATGSGGTMVFGINRDELTITGLEGEPHALRDQLGDLIRAAVVPTPDFMVSDHRINGKTILSVEVRPGQMPPYGIITNADSRDKPAYYVRRGASTYPAQPGDLREAVLRRREP